MPKKIEYPLEQILEIKQKRVEDAEKILLQRREELKKEEERLRVCEEERNKVLQHKQDKLQQLRDELDGGTTSPKVQQMKRYLDVVDDRLKVEEKKVRDQREKVKIAEVAVDEAKEVLRKRRLEVDKIVEHKSSWVKEIRKELNLAEEGEMDEIGQIIYTSRTREQNNQSQE